MKAEKLYGIALEEYRLSHDMYRDIYTKFSILLAFLGVLIGFAFGTSMKVYASIPVKPYKAHVLLYSLLMLTWLLPLMSALGLCLAGLRTKYIERVEFEEISLDEIHGINKETYYESVLNELINTLKCLKKALEAKTKLYDKAVICLWIGSFTLAIEFAVIIGVF